MFFALDVVVMQLRAEGHFGLGDRAGESDAVLAGRNAIHRESLLFEPRLHLGEIGVRQAKAGAEFLLSEPLVILQRARILLRRD